MTSSSPSLPAASASAAAALSASRPGVPVVGPPVAFPLVAGRRPRPLILVPCPVSKAFSICCKDTIVVNAGLNKVSGITNDVLSKPKTDDALGLEKQADTAEQSTSSLSQEAISEFMAQVATLAKLVDSKDIVELQLKQKDYELIIRKKEALPQPPASAPVVMMHHSPAATSSAPVLPPAAHSTPSTVAASAAQPPSPATAKVSKSLHPPLKSPMSGTFYRSPGPGQPPFVKVGDKVKKGQVLCIIEAMKLMNEIEADHEGTVTDILVEDGKPVGIEQPMFVIEP